MSTKIKKTNAVFESGPMGIVAANVDMAGHVVKHVKILGATSKNGRDYSKVINAKTAAIYENVKVYTGHPDKPGQSRNGTYGHCIARVRNAVAEADGIYGDLRMNPEHPLTKAFMWEAANDPAAAGLSHHADLVYSDQRQTAVESIAHAKSVDIVDSPATTNGIFESENPVKTLKQVLEALPADTHGKSALEEVMAGSPAMADLPVDAPVGGSSDDAIKAAFRAAIVAKFDDDGLDAKGTVAAIKDIVTSYYKLTEKPAEKPADKPAEKPAEAKTESVEAKLARLERTEEVRTIAEAAEVKLTPVQLKAAVALEAADAEAFIKSLPKPVVEAVKGGATKPKQSGSVLENESTVDTSGVPASGKAADTIAFLRGRR